ncbi:MAG: helix-turn-helix domain-containing protein [Planctomycetia bacterium]|nr:helix-turn-helix domain-containing protein [Planctomycetia bacterium]
MVKLINIRVHLDTLSKNEFPDSSEISTDPSRLDNQSLFIMKGLAGLTMEQIECCAIFETLMMFQGNRAKAAKKLRVSEKTIYNKIRHYKLAQYDYKNSPSLLNSYNNVFES